MRPALGSIAIQAVGSAATVGAALLVAATLGLAAQGEFALLRSWNDALVSAAVLGLPQSLLHLQYREGVPVGALRGWVLRYAAVLALVLLAAVLVGTSAVATGAGFGHAASKLDDATLRLLALAVPLSAAHLLNRSLLLRGVGALRYAVITALPSVLILAGLLPLCLAGAAGARFAWALLGSAAVSAAVAAAWVWRLPRAAGDGVRWSRRTLWTIGLETGGQNVLTALSPALMLSTASLFGATLAQVGAVSLGLQVYSLFAVAAVYVSPLVYDRAARGGAVLGARELFARLRGFVDARVVAVALVLLAIAAVAVQRYWPAAAASPWLLVLMALAGAVSMGVRLMSTLLLARGAFRPLTLQAVGRIACACGGTALLMRCAPVAIAVPLALLATELLLFAWVARTLQRTGGAPARSAV